MPIYDYACGDCERLMVDVIEKIDNTVIKCKFCGGKAVRIISITGQNCANQDASWLRSVLDVVNKDSKAPHVREFIKNPTRKNYQNWMKGEGLRPFEPGEKPSKPPPFDERRHHEQVWRKHRERKKIEIRR